MLSRFHPIPERYGQTDRQTDERTDRIAISISRIRMVWLPNGEKSLNICLAVSTEYRRVTDGQTDGQTDRYLATARAMHKLFILFNRLISTVLPSWWWIKMYILTSRGKKTLGLVRCHCVRCNGYMYVVSAKRPRNGSCSVIRPIRKRRPPEPSFSFVWFSSAYVSSFHTIVV